MAEEGAQLLLHRGDESPGFFLCGCLGRDAQLALPLLGIGGQGGVLHGVHLLPQQLLHPRLADPEELEGAGDDGPLGQAPEIGGRPVAEHGGTLPGRAGQHEDMDAVRLKGAARGRAPVVLKHHGPLGHVELLGVVGGHLPPDRLEKGAAAGLGLGVVHQLAAKALGQDVFGQVVTGGSQPSGSDDEVGPGPGQLHGGAEPPGIVPHHGVVVDVDPQRGEPLGEHLGVGIGDVAEQQFRTDCNQFRGM